MVEGCRILMTADAVGGVWQYACSLAAALRQHGCEILLAVLGPEPDENQQRQLASIGGIELIATGLALDWLATGPKPVREAAKALAELAARRDCDLVHLNSPLLAAEVRFPAPVVAVAHGCLSTWWEAAREEPLDPAFAWHREMTARGLHNCDIAVAPTRAYAQVLSRCYGLSRPIEAVHNGREMSAACSPAAIHDFAFTAGRLWDEVKNTPVLDAVAERLAVPFHAAGKVEGPNGERACLQHLHPLGQLSEIDMAHWLGARPVFVSAARFEPFGLAVLEAAQAGCPLVLSDIPTFRELWDGAAIFVATDDVEGYAAAISESIADPFLRHRWGEAARRRARLYGTQPMAFGMARLYATLLERKAAA